MPLKTRRTLETAFIVQLTTVVLKLKNYGRDNLNNHFQINWTIIINNNY